MTVSIDRSLLAKKYIVIGFPKTGTTSLELTLEEFGFKLGDQRKGELLLESWSKRQFCEILELVKTADAFQDTPFCLPYTYQAIESAFPNAKFILTSRRDEHQWYNSLVKFHSKIWGENGRIPTSEDLKRAPYIFKGRAFIANQLIWGCPPNDPYNKTILTRAYLTHLYSVRNYFKRIPEKLIEINVESNDDYFRLCEFCQKEPKRNDFPWLNKSE